MLICPCCNQAIEKTCEQCGKDFFPKKKSQRFCSDACRQKDHRIMRELGIVEKKK